MRAKPAVLPATLLSAVMALAVALAPAARASGAVRHDPNHKISNSASQNWAGYDVTGGTYSQVVASWTQPAVRCTGTAYSSFWVGIDGAMAVSNSVEQTGTSADCNGTTPVYSPWYEMYPKYPTNYSDPVVPGDQFTASVSTDGKGDFTLTLTDLTRGWTHSVTKKLHSAQLASAEVIAEAPSGASGILPLANFGTVGFTGVQVNGATLTNSTAGVDAVTMRSGTTVKAQPSALHNGSFAVTWKHA